MLDRKTVIARPAVILAPESRHMGDLFIRRVERSSRQVAFRVRERGQWRSSSWQQFYDRAAAIASMLLDMGLELGDKICVIGPTRPEWCYADMAGHLAGLVTLGAYPTLTDKQVAYILDHSDSRVVFVEGAAQLDKLLAIRADVPKIERVVVWNSEGVSDVIAESDWLMSMDEALSFDINADRLAEQRDAIDPESPAIIVYTSGTTGPPKGALISHSNILALFDVTKDLVEFDQDEVLLVFLPMAHVAERVVSGYTRINAGISAAFATDIPSLLDEIQEIRPTMFGSVPRIFEKAYARMMAQVEDAPPLRQKIFRWAERVGRAVVVHWQKGESIPLTLKLQFKLADRLVFAKIREVFGGRVRYFLTGAAPIAYDILEFFWAAGLPIFEAYGMTEGTSMSHANCSGAVRLGSVGKAIPDVEVKLADDGEILVRGKIVFLGYYKNPEATAETVDPDGWLHTGDIGKIDADDYLYIIDRKKHIIITAGGKNLTPANIENEIKNSDPLISQAHVHGDKRPYLTAIVTIGPSEAVEYGRQRGTVSATDAKRITAALIENPLSNPSGLADVMLSVTADRELRARIVASIQSANDKLARVETIKKVHILNREFSLQEDEITPTFKLKRKNIEKKFATEIFDKLHDDKEFGVVIQAKGDSLGH